MRLPKQRIALPLILAGLFLVGGVVLAQTGGGYDLTWWSVDGGGGTISGSGYTLTGTAGQPEPGPTLIGGDYTLLSGLWPGGGETPLPCTEVAGVTLSLLTSSDIYTDTVVLFRADLSPDAAGKPYSYAIDYDDGHTATSTSSADPLTTPLNHAFDSVGTYSVEIEVWNCGMTQGEATTGSVQVTVRSSVELDQHIYLPLVTRNH